MKQIFLLGALAFFLCHGEIVQATPTFSAPHLQSYSMQQVQVPIHVADFNSVTDFDVLVIWDPAVASLDGALELYPGITFTFAESVIHAHYDGGPLSIPDGKTLFELTFTVIGLSFSQTPLDVDVTNLAVLNAEVAPAPGVDGSISVLYEPILVNVGSYVGNENDEVSIPLTVENYIDVIDFAVRVQWDTSVIEYVGVENLLTGFFTSTLNGYGNNFDVWEEDPDTVTLVDGALLCDLVVRLKTPGTKTLISFEKGGAHVAAYSMPINVSVNAGTIEVIGEGLAGSSKISEIPQQLPGARERSSAVVYPNPAMEFVEIQPGRKNIGAQITIIDQSGNLVKTISPSMEKNKGVFRVDLKDSRKGTYLVKLRKGNHQEIVRFVKD